MEILKEISESLQEGNAKRVKELVQKAVDDGLTPNDILINGLIDGMTVIGTMFKNNEVYVPEVLIAARAMQAGMDLLKPYLTASGVKPYGKVAIGTVKGDLHDIGKNLVKMMMQGAGLEVIDLGVNVSPESFVKAVVDEKVDIVAMSALLTTTMPGMRDVIKALEEAGVRDKVKVMIGGAPVTQSYADEIGADAYTKDAASAAEVARKFVS